MQATQISQPSLEQVNRAIDAILVTLGEPTTDLHRKALSAFRSEDYLAVKRLSTANLSDHFCKSLGFLGGARKLTPNTDTILSESAREAAKFVEEKTLERLGKAIAQALDGRDE